MKIEDFIGPGTAGIAQKIPSYVPKKEIVNSSEDFEEVYVLKPNKIMACSHNQY